MPLLSRRLFTLTTLFGSPTRGSMASSSRRVIDSAVHVWRTGREPFPWAVHAAVAGGGGGAGR